METQNLDDGTYVYNMISEYFKPTIENCSGKKDFFQNITAYLHQSTWVTSFSIIFLMGSMFCVLKSLSMLKS